METPWQYDETVQVGVDYLNEKEVSVYDQRMQNLRDIDAETAKIKEVLALTPDSVIWEIGTGTGECALSLVSKCRQVLCDGYLTNNADLFST